MMGERDMNDKTNTLKAAIYGLAVGDAVGVPYEFRGRGTFECTDMIGYGTHNQPEGTWSDDTSMALATCASIKACGRVDVDDIRDRFRRWLKEGAYTPFGEVFDCGNTCAEAIRSGRGCDDEWSNGNGSLMRIIPLAFVEGITDAEIEAVSDITHAHSLSKLACVCYVRIAIDLVNGVSLAESIKRHVLGNSKLSGAIGIENVLRSDGMGSSGYVVDTFVAAMWCLLTTDNYRDCVLKAVNLGSDTDTTAAVAGGLAGIMYGLEGIPYEWLSKMKSMNMIDQELFS